MPSLRGVETAKQFLVDRLHTLDLLVALLNVAVVLDAAEDDAVSRVMNPLGARRDHDSLLGAVGMGTEAAFVDALGDEAAD